MQKARYVRLKNLTIDYTFPKQMLTKIGIQNLRIYLSGENLFTITPLKKYAKNYDPREHLRRRLRLFEHARRRRVRATATVIRHAFVQHRFEFTF